MTSKEAYELIEAILSNHSFMLEVKDKRNECLAIIKQDLERLEALEKENKELKEFQVLTKQGLWNLKQENEKLKKAFKILTQRIIIKTHKNFLFGGRHLDIANTTMKLTDEEYELLKEVLGE